MLNTEITHNTAIHLLSQRQKFPITYKYSNTFAVLKTRVSYHIQKQHLLSQRQKSPTEYSLSTNLKITLNCLIKTTY